MIGMVASLLLTQILFTSFNILGADGSEAREIHTQLTTTVSNTDALVTALIQNFEDEKLTDCPVFCLGERENGRLRDDLLAVSTRLADDDQSVEEGLSPMEAYDAARVTQMQIMNLPVPSDGDTVVPIYTMMMSLVLAILILLVAGNKRLMDWARS